MFDVRILSRNELNRDSDRWNDLWQRSQTHVPTARAEGIGLWCDTFAPEQNFSALVVDNGDEWVAGLPFVHEQLAPGITAAKLPKNHTVNSGDLLIDERQDVGAIVQAMVSGLSSVPASILSFESIYMGTTRWQQFIAALERFRKHSYLGNPYQVGLIDVLGDWQAYNKALSKNMRKSLNRARRKLEAAGRVEVYRVQKVDDARLERILDECFQIEDSGWKGENGTSILKTTGMRDYYIREARLCRDLGMLDLWLLRLDDRLIAFDYALLSKGTEFSYKIGFDPEFESFSPGRLLQYYQLEYLLGEDSVRSIDTLGVHCETKSRWTTRVYSCNRLVVCNGGAPAQMAFQCLHAGYRWFKRLRRQDTVIPHFAPAVASYLDGRERFADAKQDAVDSFVLPQVDMGPPVFSSTASH